MYSEQRERLSRQRSSHSEPPIEAPEEAQREEEDLASLVRASIQDLPAPPAVLARVLHETQKSDCSVAKLEGIIASDQAVAARVLRVVNSAYYGLARRVETLSQAVLVLGVQQIRNLALSISALSSIKANSPAQQQVIRRLWLHSLGTACVAERLGRIKEIDPKSIEILYIGGLLHDIGRLFLYTNFTEEYIRIDADGATHGSALTDIERAKFGFDHTEVGGELARKWNFPPSITSFIEGHEGPFDVDSPAAVMAVHIAAAVSVAVYEGAAFDSRVDAHALHWANLGPEDIDSLREAARSQKELGQALFSAAV